MPFVSVTEQTVLRIYRRDCDRHHCDQNFRQSDCDRHHCGQNFRQSDCCRLNESPSCHR